MNPAVRALLVAVLVFAGVLAAFLLLREDETPFVRGQEEIEESEQVEPEPEPDEPAEAVAGGSARRPPAATENGATQTRPDPVDGPREAVPLPKGKGGVIVVVTDTSETPREGVTVLLRSGRGSDARDTDRQGQAAFELLAAGKYSFRVSADEMPELVAAKEITLGPGENKTVTLQISDFGKIIAGRVLDREGNPVEGIRIFARKQMFEVEEGDFVQADQSHLQTSSGPDGKYRLEGLEPADYLLRTEATDEYPSVRKIFRSDVETADLVLDLTREFEVFGVVASTEGSPIADARVIPIGQASRQGRSDGEGGYSISLALTDGKSAYALKVTAEGFKERQLHIFEAEFRQAENWELDVELEPLERTAPVRGVIVDTENQPVAHETVTIYSAALSGRHRATTDGNGAFDLGDVQIGDYRLWVYPRRSFKDFSLDPLTVTETGLELRITLEPIAAGLLTGQIVDPADSPIPGFRLWVRSRNALGNSMEITSDDRGYFELEEVPAGELIFETRAFPRLAVRGVQFDPDAEDSAVVLPLDWGEEEVYGVVVDSEGQPVGGANVTLSWSANVEQAQCSSIRHTVTDAAGRFSFTQLSGVERKVSATASGFTTAQTTLSLDSYDDLRLELSQKNR